MINTEWHTKSKGPIRCPRHNQANFSDENKEQKDLMYRVVLQIGLAKLDVMH
jgi:hypothetical protein